MTCKDCLSDEVCRNKEELVQPNTEIFFELGECESVEKYCYNFKNKADFVEVKHGYWFIIEYDSFHCSICGKDVPSGADSTKQAKEYLQKGLVYPYCPRCGAKMDGGKAE